MNAYTDTRDATFAELYEIAVRDRNVILLTADTGAFKFKDYKKNIPRQFFNVGVSEQNAISVAAGLTLAGKKVYVFGITPFVTLRSYEQIKLDICCMNLPVTILGMGTGYGYSYDGPTHHVTQDISIMRALPGISIWSPSDPTMTGAAVHLAYQCSGPSFIRVDKGPLRSIYDPQDYDFTPGMTLLREGKDLVIAATGPMVTQAYLVADQLAEGGIEAGILDVYRLKPFNHTLFLEKIQGYPRLVTLEEHTLSGGFGSLISETLCDYGAYIPMKRIGIEDVYRLETGNREWVRAIDGLHVQGIVDQILDWMLIKGLPG